MRRDAVGEYQILREPLLMTLGLDVNGLGAICSSQHTADTDDDQVARKMLAIDSAARVFQSLEIVDKRNDSS